MQVCIIITLDNFVSDGTLGIFSRKHVKALLILCVLLRSFLLAVFLFLIIRTAGTAVTSFVEVGVSKIS